MVADTGLGWAYTVAINLTDANGSPLAGAPSGGGTVNVYGPDSATSTVHTGTATDLGGGNYGIAVPSSVHSVAGQYSWTIPTITVGGYTFIDQGGVYSVGLIPQEYKTLRAIVVAVCQALGVGIASTTTSVGTQTTLKDTRWYDLGRAANEFVDTELVILEPGATTDPRPLRVTGSDHSTGSTGTFTFAPPVGSNVASGTDYLLIRPGKRGLRYAEIIEGILAVIEDVSHRQTVTDSVTLETTLGSREYAFPSSWTDVTRVQRAYYPTAWDPFWEDVAPIYYDLWPDRRTIAFKLDFGARYRLRLTGTAGVGEPRGLGELVKVPANIVRDKAVGYLSVPREQRAGLAYGRGATANLRMAGR